MKKWIVIVAVLFVGMQANAQLGIGARGLCSFYNGYSYGGAELSFQKPSAWEINIGGTPDLWQFTGLWEFGLLKLGPIHTYAGLGPQVGYDNYNGMWYVNGAVDLGAYMLIGPIQFGFDWRPEIGIVNPPYDNRWASTMGISIRLVLGARNMR